MTPAQRTVIVTGGSRGIGAAIARGAAAAGHPVAIVYRARHDAARALVAEIEGGGGRAVALEADVAVEAQVVAAFDAAEAALGPLGGLVNNAGLGGLRMPIEAFDADALRRMFDVNVIGLMVCTREAARRMSTACGGAGGAVVNISSMAATIGGRSHVTPYAASKGAEDVFTIGAARELAPQGIRVFAVRPGMTETDMTAAAQADPARRAAIERTIAMRRMATPQEIAAPVVSLLSAPFAYLSGAVINAGGGGFEFDAGR